MQTLPYPTMHSNYFSYAYSFRFAQASPLDMTPPTELWQYITAGTKYIAYHSDLAARQEDHDTRSTWAYRVGVGLSRHAGLLVNFIQRLLADNDLIGLLAKQPLQNATVEAEALLPYLQILNFGKGSAYRAEQEHAGLRTLKKRGCEEDNKHFSSEAAIDEAVAALFDWLNKPQSALRGLLLALVASGLPFAAMAGERTLCSWIQGGSATVEIAKEAAKAVRTARMSGIESRAPPLLRRLQPRERWRSPLSLRRSRRRRRQLASWNHRRVGFYKDS